MTHNKYDSRSRHSTCTRHCIPPQSVLGAVHNLFVAGIYNLFLGLCADVQTGAGTINKTSLTALLDIGITKTQALTVLKKLHIHAITCLDDIVNLRRHLKAFFRTAKNVTQMACLGLGVTLQMTLLPQDSLITLEAALYRIA